MTTNMVFRPAVTDSCRTAPPATVSGQVPSTRPVVEKTLTLLFPGSATYTRSPRTAMLAGPTSGALELAGGPAEPNCPGPLPHDPKWRNGEPVAESSSTR